MEGREFVTNQLSPKISQGIAPTLILIRVRLGVSDMRNGLVRSGPASSIKWKQWKSGSGDLGSALNSVDNVAAVEV
jgi:hypothetical protein